MKNNEVVDEIVRCLNVTAEGLDRITSVIVWAHELIMDNGCWSSNDRWRIFSNDNYDGFREAIENRLEVFIANYTETGFISYVVCVHETNDSFSIELDGKPFIDVVVEYKKYDKVNVKTLNAIGVEAIKKKYDTESS